MTGLAAAVHENYLAARRLVAQMTPGGSSRVDGPWLVLEVPARYRGARVAVLREQPGSDTPAAIRWASDWAADDGVIVVRDTDTWALRLAASAGFVAEPLDEVAMALPLEAARTGDPATVLSVVVADEPDVKHYARLVTEENGLASRTALSIARAMSRADGVRLHLLKVEDVVVARSMSCTWDGVTGLYNVYVPPAFRGRGFGRAISLAALGEGQRSGAALACLQANAAGLPLYRKLGFQALFHYLSLSRAG